MKAVKTIGVGIIGLSAKGGWAANAHVPALRKLPQYEIRGLCASNQANAAAAAEKFGVPFSFDNPLSLVAHPEIDLAVVAVKVPQHYGVLKEVLRSGKMIYCEWPLGRNLAEGVELADLAKTCKIRGTIGLQSRVTPAINYARDLIKDGFVGEVLSTSVVGSGIYWGATLPASSIYTLVPENGAGMLNVSFAHGLDSTCYVLDSNIREVSATLENRRKTVEIIETAQSVPMNTPDQVIVHGKMQNESVFSVHYRGGLSRGTNFCCEVNGTRGDLVIASSLGYPAVGDVRIQGAQNGEPHVHNLAIPSKYLHQSAPEGPPQAVFYNYLRIAQDIQTGSHLAPTFDDAVLLHRIINSVQASAKNGSRTTIQAE